MSGQVAGARDESLFAAKIGARLEN